mgnify:FL=1|tara:strand:+ start:2092 stop:3882 length:1791 start_codon:yes stop_codon:yes gene_type:complete
MDIKKPLINYTSRDFASIKGDLLNYAQKYYPEAFRDFNESSFGSLMVDMVSYVGDMLSFYVDYQANESFLSTAVESENVIKLSKALGYKFRPNAASHGEASFFISVPAQTNITSPDLDYAPILKRGTSLKTADGKTFTLIQDIDFAESEDIVVAEASADGTSPTRYAIKAQGLVMSGELMTETFNIGAYERFRQVEIEDPNLTEVISVFDADGNNYYEVDYLTQDSVYIPVPNTQANKSTVENILKPVAVPRRFVVEQTFDRTLVQFGFGTDNNEERRLDPATVILDVFGKDYITEKSFDPTVLISTNKLGVAPTNTTLTVIYRRNSVRDVNAAPGTLTGVSAPIFKFLNIDTLAAGEMNTVKSSLEVTNETAITGDASNMTTDELKIRSYGTYAAQNRAVTREDYVNLVYNMPSNFGQVKKAAIERDVDSFNGKNLNLYVISTDSLGLLQQTNTTIKQNLKTWVSKYKMLGDTLDILDARIQNVKIFFTVAAYASVNKHDVLESCLNALSSFYANREFDIGEELKISDVYKVLNNLPGVIDTKDVTVEPVSGQNYSDFSLPFHQLISPDGRSLRAPSNVVFEVKYPLTDIDGEVV